MQLPINALHALPSNVEAEKAVVSLAMQSAEWLTEIAFQGFTPLWLHFLNHRVLWEEILWHRREKPHEREVDAVTLQTRLIATGKLEAVGGPAALLELQGMIVGTPSPENAAYFTGILREAWQRRAVIEHGTRLVQSAYTAAEGFDRTLGGAIKVLSAVTAPSAASKLLNGKDVLVEFIQELEEAIETGQPTVQQGVSTGFAEIDEKVGGLVPDFWLIGADTSGGKTVLAMQLVRAVLRAGQRALVFPLEMTPMKLIRRVVSAEGVVPMTRLVNPWKLEAMDMAKITGPGADWNSQNLTIYNDSDVTIQEVRTIARTEHAREPLGCVLLDYAQLASAGHRRDQSNREQEISFIGAECKRMSNELGIPVIAPTQLNDDGKVRESRALKHHAAVYLVIEEQRVVCAKNRDGERDWSMPYTLAGDIQSFVR